MKSRFQKAMAVCLILGMTAAICSGCSAGASKGESTQATIPPTVENRESSVDAKDFAEPTAAAETSAQKAIRMYADLLKANPTITNDSENTEVLGDLSFGYDENMAKFGMHYDRFAVKDLNQDGIPELIAYTIINHGWVPVSVFQYLEPENELRLLKDPLAPESHATFECMSTAGGRHDLYICKDNHLHSLWSGDTPVGFQEENHAYVFNPEGLAAVDCAISSNTSSASDIAVKLWEIAEINDEEAREALIQSANTGSERF